MGRANRLATVVACIACAVCTGAAPGAPGVGDGAAAEPAHAWMIVPKDEGARVLHLPPRARAERPGAPGSVRTARDLAKMPVAAAAVGSRLYLAFRDGDGHSVLSGRALISVGGLWTFEPTERLDAHPRPPEGTLLGFVGTDPGPTALVATGSGPAVVRLGEDAWEPLGLPEFDGPSPGFAGARLARLNGDPALVLSDGSVRVHRADAWSHAALPPVRVGPGATLLGVGAQLVAVEPLPGGGVELTAFDASGAHTLGNLPGVTSDMTVTPILLDGGRIALVWREPGERDSYRMAELSATTGAVLYEGGPKPVAPVSAGEFRLLAGLLVVVAAAVLLIAVKPAGEASVVLPEAAALAEPGRRFAATIIDLSVAMFVTAQLLNVRVLQIATMQVIFEPGGWVAIPGVLVAGALIGTVFEAAFGRTIGKFLLGCRVVRSDGSGAGPGLIRSAVRNAVKWGLPPIPSLALFEPSTPHRGDLLAGAVVIIDIEPEAGTSAEP